MLLREVTDQLIEDGLLHVARGNLRLPEAAETLGVLTRSARSFGDERLRVEVERTARWMCDRLADLRGPGLLSGTSGAAWALYDAAVYLGDGELAQRATALATRAALDWPDPGVSHGVAGAGMALLHLWKATADPRLERLTMLAAGNVLQAMRDHDGQLVWPIPDTGQIHYGLSSGVAGVGAFMLYAGLASGRPEFLGAALRAGETLHAVALTEGLDGGALWPSARSSGVGTFLVRLWLVSGERRFRDLATGAATAVRANRGHWLGLAADGEFLLDLAEFTGDQRFRDWAYELAAVMDAGHEMRDGLRVLPDGPGAVGFLMRLRHGGPRPWLPDELIAETGIWARRLAGTG